MATIDLDFRDELNAVEGGVGLDYCFQCGACVGDCPAARYSERFNPRQIMLRALLGLKDDLLGEESPIWECTCCYTCYERCPQDVKPIDVIVALKNLATRRGTEPEPVRRLSGEVLESGRTVKVGSMTHRRRSELGLEEVGEAPVEELRRLFPRGAVDDEPADDASEEPAEP